MHRAVRGTFEPAGRRQPTCTGRPRPCSPPGPNRSASRSSPPTCAQGLPDGEFFGVITQLPGAGGEVVDWTELVGRGPRARCAGRDRRRPAGADADHPAGRDRCRRGLRQHPTLRRANGIRRTARRLSGRARQPCPAAAGPAGRGVGGRRRIAGLPAVAADPRAAHPPRQGDQQHLHRAGSAGGDRRDVRQLSRRRRPDRDRPPGARPRPRRGRRALGGGRRGGARPFFDTVLASVPGRAEEVRDEAKSRGINVWLVDDDHVSVSCDEATTAEHVDAVLAAFGAATRRGDASTGPTSPPGRRSSSPIPRSPGTAPRPR